MSVVGKDLRDMSLSLAGSDGKIWQFPECFKKNMLTLLYFYPKDDTPGCTKQAMAYRDMSAQFQTAGIQILGVSKDSVESHELFINNHQLTFPLLSDPQQELAQVFEVTGRDTFTINDRGYVIDVWKKVNPKNTAQITFNKAQAYLQMVAESRV